MEKDVLSAVDTTILDICDEIKEKKNLVDARAELITALAELLKARAGQTTTNGFSISNADDDDEDLPFQHKR